MAQKTTIREAIRLLLNGHTISAVLAALGALYVLMRGEPSGMDWLVAGILLGVTVDAMRLSVRSIIHRVTGKETP